ncbi:hypothetical protein CW304_21295 [Bacillus sp. UFRGS-B20]|nr:hypothetical protein CW304_21295 [Bacillus sp. UFRGS-B20]
MCLNKGISAFYIRTILYRNERNSRRKWDSWIEWQYGILFFRTVMFCYFYLDSSNHTLDEFAAILSQARACKMFTTRYNA